MRRRLLAMLGELVGKSHVDSGIVAEVREREIRVELVHHHEEPVSPSAPHSRAHLPIGTPGRSIGVPVRSPAAYQPGQKVLVRHFEVRQGLAAVLLFGMPVVVAGLVIALVGGRGAVGALSLTAGLMGLAIGMGLVVLGDAVVRRYRPPRII